MLCKGCRCLLLSLPDLSFSVGLSYPGIFDCTQGTVQGSVAWEPEGLGDSVREEEGTGTDAAVLRLTDSRSHTHTHKCLHA